MRKRSRVLVESLENRQLFAAVAILADPNYVDTSTGGAIPTGIESLKSFLTASGANTVSDIPSISDPDILAAINGTGGAPPAQVILIPTLVNGSLSTGTLSSTAIGYIQSFMTNGGGVIVTGDPSNASTNNTDFIETLLAGTITNISHSNPTQTLTSFQRGQAIGTKFAGLTRPLFLTTPPTAEYLDVTSLPTTARQLYTGPGSNVTPGHGGVPNDGASVVGFRYSTRLPLMYLGWNFVNGGTGIGGAFGDNDWKFVLNTSIAQVTDTGVVYDDPTTPSDLVATAGTSNTSIQLQWTDNSGLFGSTNETGFVILQADDAGGTPGPFATRLTPDAPADATSYNVTGLLPGTTYYFEVAAIKNGVFTSFSNIASATTGTGSGTAPAAPSGLTGVSNSGSTVDLSWFDNSNDESGFRIKRADSVAGPFLSVGTVGADATSFQDTGLTDGTIYFYEVQSYNAAGGSGFNEIISVTTAGVNPNTPASPTSLTGSNGTPTTVDLTFTDLATNETAYQVEQATSIDGPFAVIATLPADSTTYTATGLTTGTVYYFRVRALNGNFASDYSVILPWTAGDVVGSGTPIPPTDAGITLISPSELTVFWKDNAANETGYTVERGNSANGPWFVAGTVAADVSSLYFSGLGDDTTYFFRVRATNSSGDASYSNVASAHTAKAKPPAVVQSLPPADIIVQTSVTSELPIAVVSGTKGKITMAIVNNGAGSAKAIVTIKVVASLDNTDDPSDIVLTTVNKTYKLAPGRITQTRISFTYPLSTPAGAYHLLADPISVTPIVGTGSNPTVSVSYVPSTTISIAPPFINLAVDTLDPTSPAFTAGGIGTAQFVVSNTGNVRFDGSPTFVLKATGGSVSDLTLATDTRKLRLKPGVEKKIKVKFIVPFNFTGGIYRLSLEMTPPAGTVDTNPDDNATTSLGQFGVGVPNGNVTPPASNAFTLGTGWTSLSSTSVQYVNPDGSPHSSALTQAVGKSNYTVSARINLGVTAPNGTILGLVARSVDTLDFWFADTNYHFILNVGSGAAIFQDAAGTFTNLTGYTGPSAIAANTDYDVSFTVAGSLLSGRVRRVADGLYLQPDDTFGAGAIDAVSASNTAITDGGFAGVIGFATDTVSRTVSNIQVS